MTTADRIAERITAIREARQRSVSWLSEHAGLADKTLRRRFAKPGPLTFDEVSAICTALDVDIEDFLNFEIDVATLTSRVRA